MKDFLAVVSCLLLFVCFISGLIWFWYVAMWAETVCLSCMGLLTLCLPFLKIFEN